MYQTVKDDLCLSSISGGTDIISCFVAGNPIADLGPLLAAMFDGRTIEVTRWFDRHLRGAATKPAR